MTTFGDLNLGQHKFMRWLGADTWRQFHREWSRWLSLISFWKLLIQDYSRLSQVPMSYDYYTSTVPVVYPLFAFIVFRVLLWSTLSISFRVSTHTILTVTIAQPRTILYVGLLFWYSNIENIQHCDRIFYYWLYSLSAQSDDILRYVLWLECRGLTSNIFQRSSK